MTRNEVLVVGAGPSGLFAASELARHGVEVRLVEREMRPHREARATAVQPATLETWILSVCFPRSLIRPSASGEPAFTGRICPSFAPEALKVPTAGISSSAAFPNTRPSESSRATWHQSAAQSSAGLQ